MADGSVKIDVTVDDGDAKKKLEGVGDAAEEAADGVEKLGDSTDDAGKGLDGLGVAVGNFAASALSSLIGKLGESVQALFSLAEETREFRDDMAKLDTAFTTAGHSTDTAKTAYQDFYAILGESDRSVEAVNHLAELTNNEQELAQWSTIAAGVTGKFGDSLPIEGLTEAANETAKVGQVTGVLADALNWASGDSAVFESALGGNKEAMAAFNKALSEGANVEDAFTAALGEMSTEEERSAAITNTLNGLYSEEAAKYNELTGSTQEARRATAEMEQAQADLGAAVEPVTTAWTNLKTQAFEAIQPAVSALAGKFTELIGWLQQNPAVLAAVSGALIALGVALGVVTAAVIAQTVAQWAQNAAWLANPITWIVIAIVAAVGALVGAFLYLWNNCEGFREFFTNMWEGIKSVAMTAWEAISGVFTTAWDLIKAVWDTVQPYFSMIWENIQTIFSVVGDVLSGFFEAAWTAIQAVWDVVTSYFQAIWDTIAGIFSVVKNVLSGNWSEAWAAIKGIVNSWKAYFQSIWNGIKSVFSAVGSFFRNAFNSAVSGIKSVFGNIKSFFSDKWKDIKNVFKKAKDDFMSVGKNIVEGIKQGIKNAWNNLKEWFKGLFGDLKAIAKKILGIKSPSREFAYIGRMIVEGLEKGIKDTRMRAITAVEKLGLDMIDAMSKNAKEQVKVYTKIYDDLVKAQKAGNKKITDEQIKAAEEDKKFWEDRDKALDSVAEKMAGHFDDLRQIEKDYASDVKSINAKLREDIDKEWDKYNTAFNNRVSAIKNELKLFDIAEKGEKVKGSDMVKAVNSQISVLEDYNKALDNLKEKDVLPAFVQEMTEMGIDALPYLEAINAMTDEELNEYVTLWEKKNGLAAEAAVDELSYLKDETHENIKGLESQAETDLAALRTTYRNELIGIAEDIGKTLKGATNSGLEELGTEILGYTDTAKLQMERLGEAMMDGMIEGMESREGQVLDLLMNNIGSSLDKAKAEMGIHSPSTKTRDELGKPIADGILVGFEEKMRAIKQTMVADMQGALSAVKATIGLENARYGYNSGVADIGMSDLTRAVGMQTAGINSLAGQFVRGSQNMRPVIIQLDGRELGRTVIDVSGTETNRVGKLSLGGAY